MQYCAFLLIAILILSAFTLLRHVANTSTASITFSKEWYPRCDVPRITVIDPAMNVQKYELDTVNVRVWSTTDKGGVLWTLRETTADSGIFSDMIRFIDAESSANGLRAEEGDNIFAKYDNLTATAKIYPAPLEPIQRILVSNATITSLVDEKLLGIEANSAKIIQSKIGNNQCQETQPFFYVVHIKDEDGFTAFLSFIKGTLQPFQSLEVGTQWIPSLASNYEIEIFVWDDPINPKPLSEVTRLKFEIR